jgi:hypothetical protein
MIVRLYQRQDIIALARLFTETVRSAPDPPSTEYWREQLGGHLVFVAEHVRSRPSANRKRRCSRHKALFGSFRNRGAAAAIDLDAKHATARHDLGCSRSSHPVFTTDTMRAHSRISLPLSLRG